MKMKNKLTLLFTIVALLFINVICVMAVTPEELATLKPEGTPSIPQPIFPKGAKKLSVTNRLNELAIIAYNVMPEKEQKRIEQLFHKLDHTDRSANQAQCDKHCGLHLDIQMTFSKYMNIAVATGVIVEPEGTRRKGSIYIKSTIVDGANYG